MLRTLSFLALALASSITYAQGSLYIRSQSSGGSGTVGVTGTPTANQCATWSDATTLQGTDCPAFTDPGADKIFYWRDSDNSLQPLTLGTGLTLTTGTLTASGGGSIPLNDQSGTTYIVLTTDAGKMVRATHATAGAAFTLPAAATAGAGFAFYGENGLGANQFTGTAAAKTLSWTPASGEQIDSLGANVVLKVFPGDIRLFISDGTGWVTKLVRGGYVQINSGDSVYSLTTVTGFVRMEVACWGGGGSGGGGQGAAAGSARSGGGGGGGGGYTWRAFRPGEITFPVSVTVGAGAGTTSAGANGTNGNATTFGALMTSGRGGGAAGGAAGVGGGGGGGGTCPGNGANSTTSTGAAAGSALTNSPCASGAGGNADANGSNSFGSGGGGGGGGTTIGKNGGSGSTGAAGGGSGGGINAASPGTATAGGDGGSTGITASGTGGGPVGGSANGNAGQGVAAVGDGVAGGQGGAGGGSNNAATGGAGGNAAVPGGGGGGGGGGTATGGGGGSGGNGACRIWYMTMIEPVEAANDSEWRAVA